jgi:hypothetical protein
MKKLEKGDYVVNLSEQQFDELQDIENHNGLRLPYYNDEKDGELFYANGLVYDDCFFHSRKETCTNLLSFDDFKQRAINTFKS